ncbi:hypothetical protein [Sphaerisporangium sp. TRM90804]|uniref:hypothetical protein n=1 Tax=Sphaerisporangium sp. TRM90804 TaxID=3031113 RepID=UPI00244C4160|nr:hypothetical protein [Sphaerisporangium sp. TRM90804]MDH2425798.1 hypothetical protein [Sphaerisporangium sp. TRM90804]
MREVSIRQPLVLRGALALVGVGVVRLGVWAGWLPTQWADVDVVSVEQMIDGAILVLAWWSTHRRVTPVAAPRDNQGRGLRPANSRPYTAPE